MAEELRQQFCQHDAGADEEHESVLVFSRGKWTYNRQMQERTGGGSDRVKYKVAFRTQSDNYRAFDGSPDGPQIHRHRMDDEYYAIARKRLTDLWVDEDLFAFS